MPFSSADPNAFLGVGMQSALGTPQVTATKLRFAKYLSGTNLTPNIDVQYLREGGDGLDWGSSFVTMIKGSGQVVLNGRPEGLGQMFQLMPGAATWGGGSVPATHLFHTGHASFPYATFLVQHPGSLIGHRFSDTRVTGLTIEGAAQNLWKITLPFVTISPGASFAAVTPTYGLPGTGADGFWTFAGGSYQLDGSADTKITSFKIDANLGVEELYAQAVTPDDIVIQNRDLNVEIVRRIEDATLWKKIYYGGGVQPTTSVATGSFRGVAAFDSGSNLRQVDVNLPLLSYTGGEFGELDPDGKTVYQTVQAKALKGATHAMVILLANGHASAYAS